MPSSNANEDELTRLDLERAVDIHEVSRLLGFAEISIRQRLARGEGPRYFRVGRNIRFRLGDVLAYRDARTVGRREP